MKREREREGKRERERERVSKSAGVLSIPHSVSQSVSMRDYYINDYIYTVRSQECQTLLVIQITFIVRKWVNSFALMSYP